MYGKGECFAVCLVNIFAVKLNFVWGELIQSLVLACAKMRPQKLMRHCFIFHYYDHISCLLITQLNWI